MSFSVVCHVCGHVLYEGNDMIPIYRFRRKTDGRCPSCGRKLAICPLSLDFGVKESGLSKVTSRHFETYQK